MIVWEDVRTERISSPRVLDVRDVRALVRRMLADSADRFDLRDVDLMVCEIVTNAVRYSASGTPGGGVWVTALVSSVRLRVEIQDDGGSDGRPAIPAQCAGWAESGRGLLVVAGFADRWGVLAGRGGSSTVWFEVAR
ncbi:ATP-binding protein [Actinomadura physcomitrii]|uniref:ATP-binding protein n=1 Tax=Actinomadura physcomitrii TaxID=2650748 RepID=UPI00136D223C|nr:ATP-binding protein [Actinomadura physcomitrii]